MVSSFNFSPDKRKINDEIMKEKSQNSFDERNRRTKWKEMECSADGLKRKRMYEIERDIFSFRKQIMEVEKDEEDLEESKQEVYGKTDDSKLCEELGEEDELSLLEDQEGKLDFQIGCMERELAAKKILKEAVALNREVIKTNNKLEKKMLSKQEKIYFGKKKKMDSYLENLLDEEASISEDLDRLKSQVKDREGIRKKIALQKDGQVYSVSSDVVTKIMRQKIYQLETRQRVCSRKIAHLRTQRDDSIFERKFCSWIIDESTNTKFKLAEKLKENEALKSNYEKALNSLDELKRELQKIQYAKDESREKISEKENVEVQERDETKIENKTGELSTMQMSDENQKIFDRTHCNKINGEVKCTDLKAGEEIKSLPEGKTSLSQMKINGLLTCNVNVQDCLLNLPEQDRNKFEMLKKNLNLSCAVNIQPMKNRKNDRCNCKMDCKSKRCGCQKADVECTIGCGCDKSKCCNQEKVTLDAQNSLKNYITN